MKLMRSRRTLRSLATVLGTALVAVGVSRLGVTQSDDAPPVSLETSINALMVALVDHAAHEIWEAASAERLTGRDWQTVEQHALQLVASGALISLAGTGPQDAAWATAPAWQAWARELTDGGLAALDAVEKSNQRALHAAGEAIADTCFGCHDMFKPDAPTEGLLHVPHYED
jgi:hypothetical protein